MSNKLTANVIVLHPETSAPHLLKAGSELPDWAADQVGDHVLEGKSDEDAPKDAGDDSSGSNPPPLAGAGASKAKWSDYAEVNDVDVTDGMSRDDIVEACRAKGVRVG